jgi:hypothetical protein
MRASISEELVDDILFIRYNHIHKFDFLAATATEEDMMAVDSFTNIDDE